MVMRHFDFITNWLVFVISFLVGMSPRGHGEAEKALCAEITLNMHQTVQ